MRVLHIVATPRGADSHTLRVSSAYLERLQEIDPDLVVETFNVFEEEMPELAGANTEVKYALTRGESVDATHAAGWQRVEAIIEQFLAADVRLISTPMWNFSIPHELKHYIDVVVQPSYLYAYDEHGVPAGLAAGKRVVCVTSRGGDYSPTGPMADLDFQEVYLRAILGFVGITDLTFVHAQPMDITEALREAAIAAASDVARGLAGASVPLPA